MHIPTRDWMEERSQSDALHGPHSPPKRCMRQALCRFWTSFLYRRRFYHAMAPSVDSEVIGSFRRLAREPLPYAPDLVVEKWRSTASGLTVLWAQFDNPLLNAYITVASEIFTDSGVPHTLEHLVFLGSQQYPYKLSLIHI